MIYGRTEELNTLNEIYASDSSSVVMVYGRTNIGKTALIKEFIKDKDAFYYCSALASEKEQLELLKRQLSESGIEAKDDNIESSIDEELIHLSKNDSYASYAHLLKNIVSLKGDKKLIIIEEFQNIVKTSREFMAVICDLVKGKFFNEKVCVIVTSSSVSWVENSMVSSIGEHALSIQKFIKLKELSFVDIVRMFPNYSVMDDTVIFAITGGVPGYLARFSGKMSLRDNIIRNILKPGSVLRNEGAEFIKEELRETSLYNTILFCIASGENKLNELHAHTGFGRDKISVYLKNLADREIVEKIYSYDIGGKEYTRKGLYSIKSGFTEFWFKFIYPNESKLNILGEDEFYDRYIAPEIYSFAREAFVKVSTEFIELMDAMDKLEIKINRRGRWWGKTGNIDIVACDNSDRYLVGKCNWDEDVFTFTMFEELMLCVNQAGVGKDYIYLFSKDTFDEELKAFAKDNKNVRLISLTEL